MESVEKRGGERVGGDCCDGGFDRWVVFERKKKESETVKMRAEET